MSEKKEKHSGTGYSLLELCVTALTLALLYSISIPTKTDRDNITIEERSFSQEPEDFGVFLDKDSGIICVVDENQGTPAIFHEDDSLLYAYVSSCMGESIQTGYPLIPELHLNEFEARIVDISKPENPLLIDMFSALKSCDFMKYFTVHAPEICPGKYNGEPYLVVYLMRNGATIHGYPEDMFSTAWIPIKGGTPQINCPGEVYGLTYDSPSRKMEYGTGSYENIKIIKNTDLLKLNGIRYCEVTNIRYDREYTYILFSSKYLPEENDLLYGTFPDLKKYRSQKDKCVHLFFPEKTPEADIITYITDPGKKLVFDGLYRFDDGTYGTYETDGGARRKRITEEDMKTLKEDLASHRENGKQKQEKDG